MAEQAWIVGIDIGGTFTDMVAVEEITGCRFTSKALTTPSDPLEGVFHALDQGLARHGIPLSAVRQIVHGTTLATNTLIERKGARVGLLTTEGFRDVLAMGRADRYDLYDLQIDSQPPLVVPERCLGVVERMDARGQVIKPLAADSLQTAIQTLERETAQSVAVCFLHAYANDSHEVAAAEAVARALPEAYISRSADVAPVIREYDRFVATAINAYVGPSVAAYLARLESALVERGFGGSVRIMKSDGGLCPPDEASRYPVRILESGPAAGVISSAYTATQCGQKLAIAFDMGGTTAKASLVIDGAAAVTEELEVSRLARFNKRSGLPVCLPSVDLLEVGAGGGSIATIGPLGLLQVGPESAEADPGPACYGRGGRRPTVTDADLLLGYLNPDYFAGGAIRLDVDAASRAISEHILASTGADDVVAAAWGIRDIVDENMARAVRLQCVEHGVDPEAVTLIATGGAGPLHASSVMEKLGARRLICPPDAGVASAFGMIVAPRTLEHTVTGLALLEDDAVSLIEERLGVLEQQLRRDTPDFPAGAVARRFLHLRLKGQFYTLRIQVPAGVTTDSIRAAFEREYASRFGRPPGSGNLEIVNWTVVLIEARPLNSLSTAVPEHAGQSSTRRAYFGPRYGWRDVPVVSRTALDLSRGQAGPLLVEEAATTTVVGHNQQVYRDEKMNLIIERDT